MSYRPKTKSALPKMLLAALCVMLAADAAAAANAREASFQKRTARRKTAPARRVTRPAGVKRQTGQGAAEAKGEQGGKKNEQGGAQSERQVSTSDTSTLGMTPDEALAVAIREALRQPRAGETRALGVLKLVECGPRNEAIFHVRVGAKTLKLDGGDLGGVHFTAFTPRAMGSELSCGPRPLDHSVVVTYRATPQGGQLVAVEFVPEGFTLDR